MVIVNLVINLGAILEYVSQSKENYFDASNICH